MLDIMFMEAANGDEEAMKDLAFLKGLGLITNQKSMSDFLFPDRMREREAKEAADAELWDGFVRAMKNPYRR